MDHVRQLKRQMQVVSNPRHRESIGGFSLLFVGNAKRTLTLRGWWRTRLDCYALDVSSFPQRLRIAGKRREFLREANRVVLYGPGVPYEEYFEGPITFDDCWIVFREARAGNPLAAMVRKGGFCQFRDDQGIIRGLIGEAASIADPDPAQRWVAEAAFLQILAHLHRAFRVPDGELRVIHPLAGEPLGETSAFREKVMAILKRNLKTRLSVEALARHLGMSRSTLSHRFSLEMGETFPALVNRLRMEKAQKLICQTGKQMKEIAFEVGFDDQAYFSRRFEAATGLPPTGFRALMMPPGQEAAPGKGRKNSRRVS